MNPLLFDINLLKDSREFFESKTPKILGFFIYLVLFILIVLTTWASLWEMEIMAKAPVLLRPSAYVSVVKNVVPGVLRTLYVKNGDIVKVGEKLWDVDSKLYDIDLDKLIIQRDRDKKRVQSLGILKESFTSESSMLSATDSELVSRWEAYFSELHRLKLLSEKAKVSVEREKSTPGTLTTTSKIIDLETEYQIAQLTLNSWRGQQLVQLREEIESYKKEWENLDGQVKSISKQKADASIIAPVPGTIEVLKKLNQNDYVGSGDEVLRIIPFSDGPLKMEIRLPDKDIAEIRSGLPVRVRMNGLTPSDYGFLTGIVTIVPPDSVVLDNGQVIYRIEGILDETKVTGRDGKDVILQAGMTGEARIILKKKTLLLYLLEQLDFIS